MITEPSPGHSVAVGLRRAADQRQQKDEQYDQILHRPAKVQNLSDIQVSRVKFPHDFYELKEEASTRTMPLPI